MTYNYSITFATLNCVEYTKKCINSLINSGTNAEKIVIVDNNSTDGTQDYLKNLDIGKLILNKQNLSCGAAWNQGILANQSEWTIVMNNDIIVTDGFAERLINTAIKNEYKIISPARIDGDNDYDFMSFASAAQKTMAGVKRLGTSNAICMCIHWSVFNQIGFFRANPNLLGFEDGLFYNEIRNSNIRHATVGDIWIHHFGSITQDHMKMVLGITPDNVLVKVNDRKLYEQSWLARKLYRHKLKKFHREWRLQEIRNHGITLHGMRQNNNFIWL